MTNEERQAAIEWLKGRPITMPGAKKMYALAAEALEAYVPDMNVGDMISRQAATTIPVMPKEHRHYQTNNIDDAYEQGWNDLQECIENLPPVQPERIKGRWLETTSRNHTYKCSVCGRLLVNITDGKNNVAKNYPYCHCGADMRGGKDG